MSFLDSLSLPVVEAAQLIKQNEADLEALFEILLSETKLVKKKGSSLLGSKSDDVLKLQQMLGESRQVWETTAKQRDGLEADIECAARKRLQCRVKQQEVDSEKGALEARCANMMQQLTTFKSSKEKLIEETKEKWAKLVYARMYYKLRLESHISLDEHDENMFTFEFFQTEQVKERLYFIKLSCDQDGNWVLVDMHPRLDQFDRMCKYLESSQDVQRLVIYLRHKFAALRHTLQC